MSGDGARAVVLLCLMIGVIGSEYVPDMLQGSYELTQEAITVLSVPTSNGTLDCGATQPVPGVCITNSFLDGVSIETVGSGLTNGSFSESVSSNRILAITPTDYDGDVDQSVTVFYKQWESGEPDNCVSYYIRNVQQSDVEGSPLSNIPPYRLDYTEAPCLFVADGPLRTSVGRVYPLPDFSPSPSDTRTAEQVLVAAVDGDRLYYYLFDQNQRTQQLQALANVAPGVTLQAGGSPRKFAIAAGDFDADGVSEFAVAFVTNAEVRLQLVRATNFADVPTLAVNATYVVGSTEADGTTQVGLAAGLFIPEQNNPLQDSLALLVTGSSGDELHHFHYDAASGTWTPLGSPLSLSTALTDSAASVTSVVSADIDGQGRDTVVALTWDDGPGLQYLHLVDVSTSTSQLQLLANVEVDLGGSAAAVGDLASARVDSGVPTLSSYGYGAGLTEQVVLLHAPTDAVYALYLHNTSSLSNTSALLTDPEFEYEQISSLASTAAGNDIIYPYVQLAVVKTIRDNVQLGFPAFFREEDASHLLAVLDTPPRHFDITGNDADDVQQINTRVSDGTMVEAHLLPASSGTLLTVQLFASWATSLKVAQDASLQPVVDATYEALLVRVGEQFSLTIPTSAYAPVTYAGTAAAVEDDRLIRAVLNWGVYEYPILTSSSAGAAVDHLLVLVPLGPSNATTLAQALNATIEIQQLDGRDEAGGLRASHEVNNALTYPTSGAQGVAYLNNMETLDFSVPQAYSYEFESGDNRSSYVPPKVVSSSGSGDELSYFGVNSGFTQGTTEQYDYSTTQAIRVEVAAEANVAISVNPESFPSGAAYDVVPYVYFDITGGQLALSYSATLRGSFWQATYADPDFTWTLPHRWDGQLFPPVLENTETGEGTPAPNAYETTDIAVSTPTPEPWESLTVYFRVRNIGLNAVAAVDPAAQVSVQLYLGDFTNLANAFGPSVILGPARRRRESAVIERGELYTTVQVSDLYIDGIFCLYGRVSVQSSAEELLDARLNNDVAYVLLYSETEGGSSASCGDLIVETFGEITVPDDDDDQLPISTLLLWGGLAFLIAMICLCCWIIVCLFVYEFFRPKLERVWSTSRATGGQSLLGQSLGSSGDERIEDEIEELEELMYFLGDPGEDSRRSESSSQYYSSETSS